MVYRFGPHKPEFDGSDNEWAELGETIAYWNEEGSKYPVITVICPHCGAMNLHIHSGQDEHRQCDLMRDGGGQRMHYDCPGYRISSGPHKN